MKPSRENLSGKKKNGPEKKAIRCALYTRVSKDELFLDEKGVMHGRKEDHSLRTQEEYCRRYLDVRPEEGYIVAEIFIDDGFSAKNQNRPALQRMFRAIAAGEIDAVVVYKIDRLTRSVSDFYDLSKTWFERDLRFISASQSFDTATIGGRLMLNILLTFAQFEREMISERTKHTHLTSISDGCWTGGPVIYGFRRKDGDLAIIDELVCVVRRVYDGVAAGRSPGEIAKELRDENIKHPTKRYPDGRHWSATTVRAMIQNKRYRGVQEYEEQEYPTKHGAIVSNDLWLLANDRLLESAPIVRAMTKNDYVFVGIGTCGICGQPLSGYPANGRKEKYDYYTCRRARKRLGGDSCPLGHIRVEYLDSLVIDALTVLGKHPAIVQSTVDASVGNRAPQAKKQDARLQEVIRRLGVIKEETVRMDQMIQDKKRPALAERMLDKAESLLVEEKKLKDERRVLELTLQHEEEKLLNRDAIAKGLVNLGRVIEALPSGQRRELLHLLVSRIVVKPWEGEKAGIAGGSIMVSSDIGTKRYLVKISLTESSLLSEALTNSVDGSTFVLNGCPSRGRTYDQVINSYLVSLF